MQIGDSLPQFNLPTIDGQSLSTSDLIGHWSVVYFYPKDNTPGCTTEAKDFSERIDAFAASGAKVVGVSKDSPKKHANFIAKHDLKVDLIADEEGFLCEAFGVWVEKQNYGRTYMGIERATFLFNPEGKLVKLWRKVRVTNHAENVLKALEDAINKGS